MAVTPGFPGDRSFDLIAPSIFRVETRWENKVASATAFVLGKYRDTGKLILATAKHVLDFADDDVVSWLLQQFSPNGDVEREVTFKTQKTRMGDVPYRAHKLLDVGIVSLPTLANNNKPMARPDEQPVQVVNKMTGVSTGTRVAWAGFPAIVESALGFPQLCYYEGVISAMVDRAGKMLYIVDGHNAPGVSGGPVWWWSHENDRLEVAGIVSGYLPVGQDLPGYCIFEPINPLVHYLDGDPLKPITKQ